MSPEGLGMEGRPGRVNPVLKCFQEIQIKSHIYHKVTSRLTLSHPETPEALQLHMASVWSLQKVSKSITFCLSVWLQGHFINTSNGIIICLLHNTKHLKEEETASYDGIHDKK